MRLQPLSAERTLPAWDDHRGILSVGATVIKQLDNPAGNQRAILCAFQAAAWASWIANPLAPDAYMDSNQRLADAVYQLNKQRKRLIRFFRDGAGKGACWELVKRRKRAGKRAPGAHKDATCFDGQAPDSIPEP